MSRRIASRAAVLVPLLLVVFVAAAPGQIAFPTPKNISISVDPTDPRRSILLHTRTDGTTFEADGQVVALRQTDSVVIVEMVAGSYTSSEAGRPRSTKAFKTLRLTFENPRGNMIAFRASYD